MARLWIDPPSGWMYGFPKIYDPLKDPPINEWLAQEGYPTDIKVTATNMWYVEEDDEDE